MAARIDLDRSGGAEPRSVGPHRPLGQKAVSSRNQSPIDNVAHR